MVLPANTRPLYWIKSIGFVLLILFCQQVKSFDFSPASQVSLLTCDPGREVYSTFGHSALRVKDSLQHMDIVFNYGTFNFNTPNFLIKFIRGKLDYQLSIEKYDDFIANYIDQQRSVREDVLSFTPEEIAQLSIFLTENYKKENRKYQYDFFFDNCSTRLRDIIETIKGEDLEFVEANEKPHSFQYYLEKYIVSRPLLNIGIDLILGKPSYSIADARAKTFLPDELEKTFESGRLKKSNTALVESQSTPYQAPVAINNFWASIVGKILLFFAAIALFFGLHLCFNKASNDITKWDKVFFTIIGLIGWFFVFMWLGTDHQATYSNPNLLWAIPIYFPFILIIKLLGWHRLLLKISFGLTLLFLIIYPIVILPIDGFILGLVVYILFRTYKIGFHTIEK